MPSRSRLEQRVDDAFVSGIERRTMPRFERFRAWMGRRPAELDGPTSREIFLLTLPLLLPLVLPVCMYLFLVDQGEFASMPLWKRVLLLPVMIFLLPAGMIYVLHNDVARPMLHRMRYRRRGLRTANKALRELTDTIPGIYHRLSQELITERTDD